MRIDNDWLATDSGEAEAAIHHCPLSHHLGGAISPRLIVIHYTAGPTADSAIAWFSDPASEASAHVVIDRDGTLHQLASFRVSTWHAGISMWRGERNLNRCSIGIELVNEGPLLRSGTQFRAGGSRRLYAPEDVTEAIHKYESTARFWHEYTDAQIARVTALCLALEATYPIEDVVGHDDIAPDSIRPPDRRKRDPGPAFPLEQLRARLPQRVPEDWTLATVSANRLNLRAGPGIAFPTISTPLPRGTRVWRRAARAGWAEIALLQPAAFIGYVDARYLS